jgi:hypothetical protein
MGWVSQGSWSIDTSRIIAWCRIDGRADDDMPWYLCLYFGDRQGSIDLEFKTLEECDQFEYNLRIHILGKELRGAFPTHW